MSHPFQDRTLQSQAPRRGSVDTEEQRAWVGLYSRVGRDAALAAEVIAQLDVDPALKHRHLALYLSCRQSLRAHKARQARDRRVGQWLGLLLRWALLRPVSLIIGVMRNAFHRSADVLAEAITSGPQAASATSRRGARPDPGCSPDRTVESVTTPVRSLAGAARFAHAHAGIRQPSAMSPVSAGRGSDAGPDHAPEARDDRPAPAVQVSRR